MIYLVLADAILFLHLLFILFVFAGGFLAARWPAVAWAHLPAAGWGAWVEFSGWICPLTPLEETLRVWGGGQRYAGDFAGHYLTALIYPEGLTRDLQFALGAAVIAVNGAAYLVAARRLRARRAKRAC